MFSKLKERISRLKEKKLEKEDKKAILVAFLSIFLILFSYYLTKNIAYPITILVILVILFLINAFGARFPHGLVSGCPCGVHRHLHISVQ